MRPQESLLSHVTSFNPPFSQDMSYKFRVVGLSLRAKLLGPWVEKSAPTLTHLANELPTASKLSGRVECRPLIWWAGGPPNWTMGPGLFGAT